LALVIAASPTLVPAISEAKQVNTRPLSSCGTALLTSTPVFSYGAQIGTVYLYYNSCRLTVWGSITISNPNDYGCVETHSNGGKTTACGYGHLDAPELPYKATTSYAYGYIYDSGGVFSATTSTY
jgi:hypothetical protein